MRDLSLKPGLPVDRLLQLVDQYNLIDFGDCGLVLPGRTQIVESAVPDLQLGYIVNQL